MANEKNSADSSDSDSEPEGRSKDLSTPIKDYGVLLRSAKAKHVELSTDDFLKLDINGTDSESELERLRKTHSEPLQTSGDAVAPVPSTQGPESCQERLLEMTKSWSEVKAKIKREREISETQLKALDDGIFSDELAKNVSSENPDDSSEEKKHSVKQTESLVRSHEEIPVESVRLHRRIEKREETFEIPLAQQNGVEKTESVESHRTREDSKAKPAPESLAKSVGLPQASEKIIKNGISLENSDPDIKLINFNKQKLLAAIKAIDDNENIDFSSTHKYRPPQSAVRSQTSVTENLYRGLPTHARKKDDLLKEIFGDGKVETKLRGGCSKLH